MRRLRTTAGAESSAQTDGAGCDALGFDTAGGLATEGGLATATVVGLTDFGNGCGAAGGGVIEAVRTANLAFAFGAAVAAR